MKKYSDILKSVSLFRGISDTELEAMLACLKAEIKDVSRNNMILLAGDKPQYVGVVLAGQIHIVWDDYSGNRLLMSAMAPGEIFAEALCCASVQESPVTVTAGVDSTVMLLGFSRILHTCHNSCPHHTKLIENMLRVIANSNLRLQTRMEITSLKSVRAKVMHYLEAFVPKQGRNITIPFNREELANFLCVERSALSHELSKMKKDGIIDYKKNSFTLNSQN